MRLSLIVLVLPSFLVLCLFFFNMSDKEQYRCFCVNCQGLKISSKRTIVDHISYMKRHGYKVSEHPWMQKFVTVSDCSAPVSGKLSDLGKLVHGNDWRKNKCHPKTNITIITYSAIILKLINKYNISVEDSDELLSLIYELIGEKCKIPQNKKELSDITDELLVKHKQYLICSNCERFVYKTENCKSCPFCKASRELHTKKYYYVPIGPRLKQLTEVKKVTTNSPPTNQPSSVDDIQQSEAWRQFYSTHDENTIALSYSSDGFNPFHTSYTSKSTYSVWAQMGMIMNLPAEIRSKTENIMLFGLISGPRAPKTMSAYQSVIVDEMATLKNGVQMYNVRSKQDMQLKANIMMIVCDVPGGAKEQNRVQQNGLPSCSHCHLKGEFSSVLDKVVYPGGRVFLPHNHPLRQDSSFPSQQSEVKPAILRTQKEELNGSVLCDSILRHNIEAGNSSNTILMKMSKETGRYGSTEWIRLGLDLQQFAAPVEPMHAIKVVTEHVIKLLNGSEDGAKVRAEEAKRGRFTSACTSKVYELQVTKKKMFGGVKRKRKDQVSVNSDPGGNQESSNQMDVETVESIKTSSLPSAPFTLNDEEKKKADARLRQLNIPIGFGELPDSLFVKVTGGVKSHTWLQIATQGIIPFCLQGMLGRQQRNSLVIMFRLIEEMFGRKVDMRNFPQLEVKWQEALAQIERDFPVSLQSFVMHLLHHLPHYIRLFGPVTSFWMFPYERFNKTLTSSMSSMKNPEVSAIHHYEVHWLLTILDIAGLLTFKKTEEQTTDGPVYLCGSRPKPVHRKITSDESKCLELYYKKSVVKQDVTVFFFATKFVAAAGKVVKYRASNIEKDSMKERSSLIAIRTTSGIFVGEISYFLYYTHEKDNAEFAYVKWRGRAEECLDTGCFLVNQVSAVPNKIVPIKLLSAPLMYAFDNSVLWIPKLVF